MIVGVVGKSNLERTADGDRVLALAGRVGEAVVRAGYVLLTGGRHTSDGRAVKDAAMRGAAAVATPLAPTRLVGVLEEGAERGGVAVASDDSASVRSVYLRTGLGDARNLVNAALSDALIAVAGGAGTLSELAFAALYERPVVLLKEAEPRISPASLDEMCALVAQKIRPRLPAADVSEPALVAALTRAHQTWPRADSPDDAVARLASVRPTDAWPPLPLPDDVVDGLRAALQWPR